MSYRHGSRGPAPALGQSVQAKFNAQKTLAGLTQRAQTHSERTSALAQQANELIQNGVPAESLPAIHSQLGEKDMEEVQRKLNQAGAGIGQQNSPLKAMAIDPRWQPVDEDSRQTDQDRTIGTGSAGLMRVDRLSRDVPPVPAVPVRTPSGLQVPATDAGGHQLRNDDESPRYIGTTKATPVTPGEYTALTGRHVTSGGNTTSTGTSDFNYRGDRTIVTPGAPNGGTEYDPRKDLGMARLVNEAGPGKPTNFPGAPRGALQAVAIDPKYVTPGASNVGYSMPAAPAAAAPLTSTQTATPTWHGDIISKYPAIGVAGSPENAAFVAAYKQHNDPSRAMDTADSIMKAQGAPKGSGVQSQTSPAPKSTTWKPGDDDAADKGEGTGFTPPPSVANPPGYAAGRAIGNAISAIPQATESAAKSSMDSINRAGSTLGNVVRGALGDAPVTPDQFGQEADRTVQQIQRMQPTGY